MDIPVVFCLPMICSSVHVCFSIHVLMRDEKEGRKKQARSKQHVHVYNNVYPRLRVVTQCTGHVFVNACVCWRGE